MLVVSALRQAQGPIVEAQLSSVETWLVSTLPKRFYRGCLNTKMSQRIVRLK
ncbi:MAG: hypothetical protein ACI38O_12680 [Fibrobacter intestinalis]|uniref:hypothetical protein n=1 Tax=Fibrobacter intestinalis TaxID=28122 RepID=UPI003F0F4854